MDNDNESKAEKAAQYFMEHFLVACNCAGVGLYTLLKVLTITASTVEDAINEKGQAKVANASSLN